MLDLLHHSVTIQPIMTCSNGVEGVEDGDGLVCCNPACGVCGGSDCGGDPGLSIGDCCVGVIVENAQFCSVTESAPCVFDVVVEGKICFYNHSRSIAPVWEKFLHSSRPVTRLISRSFQVFRPAWFFKRGFDSVEEL